MNSVAAVIVRWRNGDELNRCLHSLLEHGGPHLKKIVLVDSGSGDGGAERLESEFGEVKVIALEHNQGFAFAANRGVAASDENLLLVLNPDTEVAAGAIECLVAALDRNPAAAGTVPLLESIDGSSQHRWQLRDLPTGFRLATGRPGAPRFASPPPTIVTVEQPAAAAWLVRREVWRELGGLDVGFAPAWWEDVDFCARLHSRLDDSHFPYSEGFLVEPGARIKHMGGSSTTAMDDRTFLAVYFTNLLRYAARHHPRHFRAIRTGLYFNLQVRRAIRPQRRDGYAAAIRSLTETAPP